MAARAFRVLLALFPRSFRDAFGPEMHAVFSAQRAAAHQAGTGALIAFWWRTVTGMAAAAWREHRGLRHAGRGLPWHETLFSDIRLAARLLLRAPLFSILVVTAIAVG